MNKFIESKSFPIMLALISNIFWGFSNVFTKVALDYVSPNLLLSHRFMTSLILMTGMLIGKAGTIDLKGKRNHLLAILVLMMPVYYALETSGILYTNASFAGMMIGATPALVIVTGIIMLHEIPTKRQVFFAMLPILGVIMISMNGNTLGFLQLKGIILMTICLIICAVYRTLNKMIGNEFGFFERTFFFMLVCGIWFTAIAMVELNGQVSAYFAPLTKLPYLGCMLTLSVFCSVLANLMSNYAAVKMPVVVFSTVASVNTVFSMISGILFLGEPITLVMFIGAVLILIGIKEISK